MAAACASELQMIPVEKAGFKTWRTCSVPCSLKTPKFALTNMDFNAAPAFHFLNLAAQHLRICTAGGADDITVDRSLWTNFVQNGRAWYSWQNSFVPNASMNKKQRFLSNKLLWEEGTWLMAFRAVVVLKSIEWTAKRSLKRRSWMRSEKPRKEREKGREWKEGRKMMAGNERVRTAIKLFISLKNCKWIEKKVFRWKFEAKYMMK